MDVQTAGGNEIDFGFERLNIHGKTARLELTVLWPDTVLIGKPAMQANQAFFTAKVRSRSQRIASALIAADASRAEDVDLFSTHVLVGWEGVYDRQKKPVPFSVGAARALLRQLPDHVFDLIRGFFANPDSFLDPADADAGAAKDIAGKSTAG